MLPLSTSRHSPDGARWLCVDRRRSEPTSLSIEVSSLGVSFRGPVSQSVSQLGIALCYGRNEDRILTAAGASSTRRYLEPVQRKTRWHASARKMGKTASKLKSRRSQSQCPILYVFPSSFNFLVFESIFMFDAVSLAMESFSFFFLFFLECSTTTVE